MSWELVVRQKFSAAHFLENYKSIVVAGTQAKSKGKEKGRAA